MCKTCELENAAHPARPSRRSFLASLSAVAAALPLAGTALAKDAAPPPKPQNAVSPDGALELLRKGNDRYVDGVSKRHDFKNEREALTAGQNPYAAILSCADSRIAPNMLSTAAEAICSSAGSLGISPTTTRSPVSNMRWPIWARR